MEQGGVSGSLKLKVLSLMNRKKSVHRHPGAGRDPEAFENTGLAPRRIA
jgi:hypothetical protein